MRVAQVMLVFVAVIAYISSESINCYSDSGIAAERVNRLVWATMVGPCVKVMKAQVEAELNAALTYMAMGAHFARDKINRPGFAKMFFESASEEREHAIKIIDYLLMRGELTSGINNLIHNPFPKDLQVEWKNGLEALEAALNLEASVTKKITNIIKVCEDPRQSLEMKGQKEGKNSTLENVNDYHLVDYLTGDFLEEQFRGQRDLAGKISVLRKMERLHGDLGEYLFDKKLLNGELPAIG